MLTKKEKAAKMLELEKLDKAFKGLKLMKKTPDVLFVVDGVYENQAVKEAASLGIPCFTISNTNGDPYTVTDAIPANTNSVKSLDYLAIALKDGFNAPAKKPAPKKEDAPAKTPAAAKKVETNEKETPVKPAAKATTKKETPATETPEAKKTPAKKPAAKKTQEK